MDDTQFERLRGTRLTREVLTKNAILTGLDESAAVAILERGRLVQLKFRQKIYESNEMIQTVFFPIDCVLSVVTQMEDGSTIEIGTIERAGMSAFPLLMCASATENESYCKYAGAPLRSQLHCFAN